jgi:hypothetical protein
MDERESWMMDESESCTPAEAAAPLVTQQQQDIVALLSGESLAGKTEGATALRKLLAVNPVPPGLEVVVAGALPHLVAALDSASQRFQVEAVHALADVVVVSESEPSVVQRVVDHGAIAPLVRLLSLCASGVDYTASGKTLKEIPAKITGVTDQVTPNDEAAPLLAAAQQQRVLQHELVERAATCLGYIANASPQLRDQVLSQPGATQALANAISTAPGSAGGVRAAVWATFALCRGAPDLAKLEPLLPLLPNLLFHAQKDVLQDAVGAICGLTAGMIDETTSDGNNRSGIIINFVLESGACRRLVELLRHHRDHGIVLPAVTALGNIMMVGGGGGASAREVIVAAGAIPGCVSLLASSPKKSVRSAACRALACICDGRPALIQAVIDANVVPAALVQMAEETGDLALRVEVAAVLRNMCRVGSDVQLGHFIGQGMVAALCSLLLPSCGGVAKVPLSAMDALSSLLRRHSAKALGRLSEGRWGNPVAALMEQCGGLDSLESLQCHHSADICTAAVRIFEEHFVEEGVDAGLD